jgi:peptidoglycan hydrolase CwlO-like protein
VYEKHKNYLIIACVLVAGFACWYLFSLYTDRSGNDSVGQRLSEIEQHQQSATKRLDKIETGLSSSAYRLGGVSERITTNTERIVTVEQRIETSQTGLTESKQLIDHARGILQTAREREK